MSSIWFTCNKKVILCILGMLCKEGLRKKTKEKLLRCNCSFILYYFYYELTCVLPVRLYWNKMKHLNPHLYEARNFFYFKFVNNNFFNLCESWWPNASFLQIRTGLMDYRCYDSSEDQRFVDLCKREYGWLWFIGLGLYSVKEI